MKAPSVEMIGDVGVCGMQGVGVVADSALTVVTIIDPVS